MADDYARVELELSGYGNSYVAQITREMPGDNRDQRIDFAKPIEFDFEALLAASSDADQYGRLLTEQLFAAEELRTELGKALESTSPVRLRLMISTSALRLHSLRWETLRDPDPKRRDELLVTNQNILFSRGVFTGRGKPVTEQKPEDLKALIVIAAPNDLHTAKTGGAPLAPIDAAAELEAAKRRLAGFIPTTLVSNGTATLANIVRHLTDDEYVVLYIVCHGAADASDSYLILENDDGSMARVPGPQIETRIRELRNPPPLVVLASCKSGGTAYMSTGHHVARVGALLAVEAGIPAVIAMQGDVSLDTASTFLERFFEHLRNKGEIDWAVTVARGEIRKQSDAWMPVLYMRLLNGRLWSDGAPAVLGGKRVFDRWESLLGHVAKGKCLPIIGFGVYDELFGSVTELARRWAETYRYPLNEGDELPQIAQYLAVNHGDEFYPGQQLERHIKREIARRAMTANVALPEEAVDDTVIAAWNLAAGERDPHRILAHLPCPLYLTTNFSTVLEAALQEAGVKPQSVICRWNGQIPRQEPPADFDADAPTVYHLFGRFGNDDSLVIAEDRYFDYLLGTHDSEDGFHKTVLGKVNSSALMLLGFQITEWSLRVLFRSIMDSEGRNQRLKYTHIAVQVDPSQKGIAEPDRVYAYLSSYFQQEKIHIFRGTVADFIDQLIEKYQALYGQDLVAKRVRKMK